MLPLIDDSTVIRETGKDFRMYYDIRRDKYKWISVTSLIKWASNKEDLFKKMIIENPTLKEEWKKRAILGNTVHKALEVNSPEGLNNYELKYYKNYNRYFNEVVKEVVAKEKAIIWEDNINNKLVGFGGTSDAVQLINYNKLYYADGTPILDYQDDRQYQFSVVDYKTKKTNRLNSNPHYGLEYYLQCAANTAALNKKYNGSYKANKSLILVSTTRNLYIYYIPPDCINYYWTAFKDMLSHYYNSEAYNWSQFEKNSEPYWPTRVYLDKITS